MSGKRKQLKHTVVAQEWEESERGWGVRPDGFSLHLTVEDCNEYVRKQYEGRDTANVPDVYTRTCGAPRPVTVDDATYKKIKEAKIIWVDRLS